MNDVITIPYLQDLVLFLMQNSDLCYCAPFACRLTWRSFKNPKNKTVTSVLPSTCFNSFMKQFPVEPFLTLLLVLYYGCGELMICISTRFTQNSQEQLLGKLFRILFCNISIFCFSSSKHETDTQVLISNRKLQSQTPCFLKSFLPQ